MAKTKTPKPAPFSTTAPAAYQELSVNLLSVWEGNTRHRSDDGAEELAASIRANGILQPLLGRPCADYYEIVCGKGRLEAARTAGLTTVPVYVRYLDDAQAAAAVAAENISREDFATLDAFAAVKATLDAYGSLQAAADALARPVGWVRRVAQLEHLIGQWFNIARDQDLGLGFLCEIARLPLDTQEALLAHHDRLTSEPGGNLRVLRGLAGQLTATLSACAWLAKDKECAICSRRSDAEPELFPDYADQKPLCLSAECRENKRAAFVSAQRTAAAAKAATTPDKVATAQWEKGGDRAKKDAAHTVPVVIDQGPDSGKIVWREPEPPKAGTDGTPKGPSPQARLAAKFIRQIDAEIREGKAYPLWITRADPYQALALTCIVGIHPADGGHTAASMSADYEQLAKGSGEENDEHLTDALRPRILEKLRFAQVSACEDAYQWANFFADLFNIPVDAGLKGAPL